MNRLAAFVAGLLLGVLLIGAVLIALGCSTTTGGWDAPGVVPLIDSGLIPVTTGRTVVRVGVVYVVLDYRAAPSGCSAWWRLRVVVLPGGSPLRPPVEILDT